MILIVWLIYNYYVPKIIEKKHATSLKQWVYENRLDKKDLFLKDGTSLELKDFQVFIQTRREKMFEKLQKIIKSFDK